MSEQTATLQASLSTQSKVERRATVRYGCDLDSRCRRITTGEKDFWLARILNISAAGIGLLVSRRFELGTLLAVTLQGNDETSLHTVMARVANVRSEAANRWILGCAFTTRLSEEEILALV